MVSGHLMQAGGRCGVGWIRWSSPGLHCRLTVFARPSRVEDRRLLLLLALLPIPEGNEVYDPDTHAVMVGSYVQSIQACSHTAQKREGDGQRPHPQPAVY